MKKTEDEKMEINEYAIGYSHGVRDERERIKKEVNKMCQDYKDIGESNDYIFRMCYDLLNKIEDKNIIRKWKKK